MGLQTVFTDQADFSGIFSGAGSKAHISNVIQTLIFEVNEDGTQAAAAIPRTPPPPRPIQVRANYPFIFAILNASFDVIMMGKYAI